MACHGGPNAEPLASSANSVTTSGEERGLIQEGKVMEEFWQFMQDVSFVLANAAIIAAACRYMGWG